MSERGSEFFSEKILFCPRCGEAMIRQSQDFWRCPKCGGEWWPDEDRLAYLDEERRAREFDERIRAVSWGALCRASYKPVRPYGYVKGAKKGGGNKASGRRRKWAFGWIRARRVRKEWRGNQDHGGPG